MWFKGFTRPLKDHTRKELVSLREDLCSLMDEVFAEGGRYAQYDAGIEGDISVLNAALKEIDEELARR